MLIRILYLIAMTCPVNTTSVVGWFLEPPYENGTLVDEIQCYNLPYGGIGFASHIITYYTITMLVFGRRPLPPWRRLRHGKYDFVVGLLVLVLTVSFSGMTIYRCRHRWEFITIATWKVDLSLTFSIICIHVAMIVPKGRFPPTNQDYQQNQAQRCRPISTNVFLWFPLYIPGLCAGLAGLGALLQDTLPTNSNLKTITGVFGGAVGMFILVGISTLIVIRKMRLQQDNQQGGSCNKAAQAVALGFVGIAILAALYSDWVLAEMANNLVGVPSSDNALVYWTYFFAKRLPLFFT